MTQGIGDSGVPDNDDPGADLALGIRLNRLGDHEGARRAFVAVLRSGHPEHAPEAAVHLGVLLNGLGDAGGAQTAFQQALDSGHFVHAPRAAVELGIVLADQELRTEAEAAFDYALSSDHPDHAPKAALHLGMLLERCADSEGAQRAFGVAVDSGHPYNAPPAAIQLGQLLQGGGDLEGARQAYRGVIDSGSPQAAPRAALLLGGLLQETGDTAGARAAYQHAVDSGHPEFAPTATERLHSMDEEHATAAMAARRVPLPGGGLPQEAGTEVVGGDAVTDPPELDGVVDFRARLRTRDLSAVNDIRRSAIQYIDQGDSPTARRLFQLLVETGHPHFVAAGMLGIGAMAQSEGDLAGARRAFQGAVAAADPTSLPVAYVELGQVCHDLGDEEQAEHAYRLASQLAHPDCTPRALTLLADLLGQAGDLAGQRHAFEQVVESGHPVQAPWAATRLGILLQAQGDDEGTRAAYQQSIAFGPSDAAQTAVYLLGQYLYVQGDVDGACRLWRQVTDAGWSMYAHAAYDLSVVLDQRGEVSGAIAALRRAAGSGDPDVAPLAAERLRILNERQEPDPASEDDVVFRAIEQDVASGTPGCLEDALECALIWCDKRQFSLAKRAYRLVIDSGSTEQVSEATFGLGRVYLELNDLVFTRDTFRQVVDLGHAKFVPVAALQLGMVLVRLEEHADARQAFELAIGSGHVKHGPEAAKQLGRLLGTLEESPPIEQSEDDAGGALTEGPAKGWEDLEQETAAGDEDAIAAATGIGRRLAEGGNHADAARAYRVAIASGHPKWAPEAAVSLGMMLEEDGDLDAARRAYEEAIEYLDDEAGQEAAFWLGQLLDKQGDIEGACAAWLLVTEPRCPKYDVAAHNLGVTLKQKGDREGAVLAFRRAMEPDDPEVSPVAALRLAAVLWAMEDRPGTRAALQRAIDSGHPTHAPAAAEHLRKHFPELPGNPELSAADGPALPVLQPLDWAETLGRTQAEGVAVANALARPLTLAGQQVGYIAFSRDSSDHTELEAPGSLDCAIPDEFEAAALMNLRLLGLEWRQLEIAPRDDEPFDVLACNGHPLAASAILDRSFLAQAQLSLGCDRILVAIPNRDLLQVGRADLPGQQVAHFAGSVEAFHDSNDYPVSPLTFYATNGVVDGICDPPPLEYGPAEPAAHHPPPGIHVEVTTPVARPSDGAAPKSVQQPAAATSASTTSDSNTGELSTRQVTVSGPANRPTLTPEDVANVDERWAALRRAVEAGALHAERRALDFGVALVDQTDWVRAERVFEFLSRCRDPRTAIMASQNLQSVRGAMQWESQQC
ncbi:MAG: tetratricopeptide repeat protein [Geodermatophilaceae bacterium]